MCPSSFLPRPVRRFLLFLIIFIFVNYCIYMISPSRPRQVRNKFARREVIARGGDEGYSEHEDFDVDGDTFADEDDNHSFATDKETDMSSSNTQDN
jgi:hypothetical protein